MTWAPLGIFSTTSLRVGRTTVYRAPREERTTHPSSSPMTSSCATGPERVWNSPPTASVTRYRRSLLSKKRARSPGPNGRLTLSAPGDVAAGPLGPPLADARSWLPAHSYGLGRRGPIDELAEGAHASGGRCP